ncbi:hypothetical protein [Rubinisphaera margarita]|uniref:hypothetical protein n=1 Tax=Rubinisphaera margarita TaxID=2909586 RepID=UPI001EE8F9F1|nr:hypothetical protein [Rubinisphaera margarita]MCG6154631.1 hypothetical protein [Rubinisphaera margarita]
MANGSVFWLQVTHGFVIGPFPEWGTFDINEIRNIRRALNLPVIRSLPTFENRQELIATQRRINFDSAFLLCCANNSERT